MANQIKQIVSFIVISISLVFFQNCSSEGLQSSSPNGGLSTNSEPTPEVVTDRASITVSEGEPVTLLLDEEEIRAYGIEDLSTIDVSWSYRETENSEQVYDLNHSELSYVIESMNAALAGYYMATLKTANAVGYVTFEVLYDGAKNNVPDNSTEEPSAPVDTVTISYYSNQLLVAAQTRENVSIQAARDLCTASIQQSRDAADVGRPQRHTSIECKWGETVIGGHTLTEKRILKIAYLRGDLVFQSFEYADGELMERGKATGICEQLYSRKLGETDTQCFWGEDFIGGSSTP